MKETKITQDDRQTRATIPKVFVKEFGITKEDKMEWESSEGKLKGSLKKKEEKNES